MAEQSTEPRVRHIPRIKVGELLKNCAELYQIKGNQYGHSYKKFGKIMESLYPDGITIKGEIEFNHYGIFFMLVHKIIREGLMIKSPEANKERLMDSTEDSIVYQAMLAELIGEYL